MVLCFYNSLGISAREYDIPKNCSERSRKSSVTMINKFMNILKSLKKFIVIQNIEIEKIKWLIKPRLCLDPIFEGSSKYEMSDIDQLSDISKFMCIIEDYCSFFNYDVLEDLINDLDYEHGITLMKDYKKDFSEYIKSLIVSECPSNLGIQSMSIPTFSVKLDKVFEKCTGEYLEKLKDDIQKILGDKRKIILHRLSEGCICVTFQLLISSWKSLNVTDELISSFKSLTYQGSRIISIELTDAYGIYKSQILKTEMKEDSSEDKLMSQKLKMEMKEDSSDDKPKSLMLTAEVKECSSDDKLKSQMLKTEMMEDSSDDKLKSLMLTEVKEYSSDDKLKSQMIKTEMMEDSSDDKLKSLMLTEVKEYSSDDKFKSQMITTEMKEDSSDDKLKSQMLKTEMKEDSSDDKLKSQMLKTEMKEDSSDDKLKSQKLKTEMKESVWKELTAVGKEYSSDDKLKSQMLKKRESSEDNLVFPWRLKGRYYTTLLI